MSTTFRVLATLIIAALLAAAAWALVAGLNKLFFAASVGALFATGLAYFGSFAQSLRSPVAAPTDQKRTLSEEIEAIAKANPEHPGLKRAYGWLLVAIGVTVALRLIQLLAT